MAAPYPISAELRHGAGLIFREDFRDAKAVGENGGTLVASPTFNNGLVLNGTTQYAGYVKQLSFPGVGSLEIRFTPTFAANEDATRTLLAGGTLAAVGSVSVQRLNAAGSNVLRAYLGTQAVTCTLANFTAAWLQNAVNVLVVSFNGASSAMWLNGTSLTVTAGAMVTTRVSGFQIGAVGGASLFAGTIHSVWIGTKALATDDAARLYADDLTEGLAEPLLYLPGEQVYRRASDSKYVTPVRGRIAHQATPVTEAILGDGTTATTFPTRLTDGQPGFSFDGGDYLDLGDNDSLSFTDGATDLPFSLACVIRPSTLVTFNYGIFSKGGAAGAGEIRILMRPDGGLLILLSDSSTGGYICRYSAGGFVRLNANNQAIFTYDGTGLVSGLKCYANGARVDTLNLVSGAYTRMRASSSNAILAVGDSVPNFTGKMPVPLILDDKCWSPLQVWIMTQRVARWAQRRV